MHNSWNHANIHGTPFRSWIFIQSLYHPDLSLRFSNWTLLHDIRWIFSSLVRLLGLESKKNIHGFWTHNLGRPFLVDNILASLVFVYYSRSYQILLFSFKYPRQSNREINEDLGSLCLCLRGYMCC